MNLDELERQMIRDAQRELGPGAGVRQRHELELLARLGAGVALSQPPGAGVLGSGVRAPAARAPWFGVSGLPGRMLGVGLALGALIGGWVGYSLGQRGSERAVASHGALDSPGDLPAREAAGAEATPPAAPPAVPDADDPVATTLPSTPLVASAANEAGSGGNARPARRATRNPAHGSESSLAEELAMLQRARRALGAGNAPLALGIVQELDERFPKGVLLEERSATRVFGLCKLDRVAEARDAAREFLARHPGSVYAERVRKSCVQMPE